MILKKFARKKGRIIQKERHILRYENLKIEMDFYKGELSGLAVCEVEFDDENQAKEFLPPYFLARK